MARARSTATKIINEAALANPNDTHSDINPLLNAALDYALAYAKALESVTGVNVSKMLPIPNIENAKFPEARKYESQGVHRVLYRFSPEDYKDIARIWRGPAPTGDGELQVVDGPPAGGPIPVLPEVPEEFAPGLDPAEIAELAKKLAAS